MSDWIEVDGLRVGPNMYRELKSERDALAAHVEYQRGALVECSKGLGFALRLSHPRETTAMQAVDHEIGRLDEAARRAPAASLAHLKAECQARGLSEAFEDPIWGYLSGDARKLICDKLSKLRRQAEDKP